MRCHTSADHSACAAQHFTALSPARLSSRSTFHSTQQHWFQHSFAKSRKAPKLSHTQSQSSRCSGSPAVLNQEVPRSKQPGLVLSPGPEGTWDHAAIGNPVVRCYFGDNEQRWYMWYSGSNDAEKQIAAVAPSSGCTGVATSSNGVDWTRVPSAASASPSAHETQQGNGSKGPQGQGCVMQPGEDWWTFDTNHMAVADVQILSNNAVNTGVGVYWMFYAAGDFEEVGAPPGLPGLKPSQTVEGLRMRPGLAMSQDGLNWARIEGEHHTGALLDVGEPGEWDELFIASPQVVAAGPNDMRMYYHTFDAEAQRFVVGWASSKDGFKWEKVGPIFDGGHDPGAFDFKGVAAHQVIRDLDTKKFVMWYEGVADDGTRSIGIAVSEDGISDWIRRDRPVLTASEGLDVWDSSSVGAPCAVSMAGASWRLYYSGRQQSAAGAWNGIGMALNTDDSEVFEGIKVSFKRGRQA